MCAPDGIAVGDDTPATVASITAAVAAGIPTFLIGVSTSGGPAAASLHMIGSAGFGLDGGGTFTAWSGGDIQAALNTVANLTADCTFAVPEGSADGTLTRSHIGVAENGTEIPRDVGRSEGWDYIDATQSSIRLFGRPCAAVKTDELAPVSIIFKCLLI